jgi:hypothetical protein
MRRMVEANRNTRLKHSVTMTLTIRHGYRNAPVTDFPTTDSVE